MIARVYDWYCDGVASSSGPLAFVKWFFVGVFAQLAALICAAPLVGICLLLPEDLRSPVAGIGFGAVFVASRWWLFCRPCARAGEIKGRGKPALWYAAGLAFGQFALGAAAGLSPRRAPAPASAKRA